jgi:hypothetical protein
VKKEWAEFLGTAPVQTPGAPYLDSVPTSARNNARRKARCFHRVISGFERGGQLRLLTLTSSPASPTDIQASLRKLIMRLRRRGLLKDYLRVIEVTESGLNHVHMIFRGSYIEQREVSRLWNSIHAAPVVDIRSVKGAFGSKRKVASYLAKYMVKGFHRRYSWSRSWVYPGFVAVWLSALRLFRNYTSQQIPSRKFSQFLDLWHHHLRTLSPPDQFLGFLRLLNKTSSLFTTMTPALGVARADAAQVWLSRNS